jgi:hypothetical protein
MFYRLPLIYLVLIPFFLVFLFGFLNINQAKAASASSISVSVNPENPEPYEDVDIGLSSYANNLDTVSITWSINGKIVLSGIGKKYFSTTAGSADSETNVIVKISLPDGDVELRILIKPSSMVLLWEADDSYVPPFYKGKALPTGESSIKVVAMPEIKNNGVLINPKNMSYSWKRDYSNDQESSGYGKNFYIYTNDYLEANSTIGVSALTLDQKYTTQGSVNVSSYEPKIIFYPKNTKLGTLWENALNDNHKINGNEVIEASPYFISPKNIINPTLIWNWYINDEPISTQNFMGNILPLKTNAGVSGTAKIKLQIDNRYKIFQNTNKQINVKF